MAGIWWAFLKTCPGPVAWVCMPLPWDRKNKQPSFLQWKHWHRQEEKESRVQEESWVQLSSQAKQIWNACKSTRNSFHSHVTNRNKIILTCLVNIIFIELKYITISSAPTEMTKCIHVYIFIKHTPLTYIAQQKLFLHSCNLRTGGLVTGFSVEWRAVSWLITGHVRGVTAVHLLGQGRQRHLAVVNIRNPTCACICVEIRIKQLLQTIPCNQKVIFFIIN